MLELTQLRNTLNEIKTPMLSLYLYVDNARPENQSETPAWKIEHKNALSSLGDDIHRLEQLNQWAAIEQQLEAFFLDYTPSGRTLVLFADGQTLYHYELPIMLKSQANFGEPLTLPLLWATDEYEPYLIVQVDSEQARFINAYLGNAAPAGEMRLEVDEYDFGQKTLMPALNSTQPNGGNDQDSYDKTIQAHVQRFYNEVIEEIRRLATMNGAQNVIISGDEKAAHMLYEQMSQADRGRVAGVTPAPLSLSDDAVLTRLLDTALAYERDQENELIGEIVNAAKSGGRAALGAADVIEALIQNRVELLVLPYPPRTDDIANNLKAQAFERGTPIELVHGSPADKLEDEGGVGARLYYAV